MKKFFFLSCFVLSLLIGFGCCVHAHTNNKNTDFVEHLKQSTVVLVFPDSDLYESAYCAGVWINEQDFITARHCIESPSETIRFQVRDQFDGLFPQSHAIRTIAGTVIAHDKDSDLAVIRSLEDVNHDFVYIAIGNIYSGTHVNIVGHPQGIQYTYFDGIVSETRRADTFWLSIHAKILQIASFVCEGNSGGGAFNDDGELVGITSFIIPRRAGLTFFIHKDEVIKLLDQEQIKYYTR